MLVQCSLATTYPLGCLDDGAWGRQVLAGRRKSQLAHGRGGIADSQELGHVRLVGGRVADQGATASLNAQTGCRRGDGGAHERGYGCGRKQEVVHPVNSKLGQPQSRLDSWVGCQRGTLTGL